jgi:hypothetical protein
MKGDAIAKTKWLLHEVDSYGNAGYIPVPVLYFEGAEAPPIPDSPILFGTAKRGLVRKLPKKFEGTAFIFVKFPFRIAISNADGNTVYHTTKNATCHLN